MLARFIFRSALLTFLIRYSEPYAYIPSDRHIEVVASDEYLFGIEEDFGDEPIVKCYYTTDTGISGSFDVSFSFALATKQNSSARLNSTREESYYNVITTKGDDGLCQILVANVDDTGPRLWKLTAAVLDGQSKEVNTTEAEFNVQFFYRGPILSYMVAAMEYSSFYNYFKLSRDITLTSCKLQFRDAEIELDVNSPKSNVFLSPYSLRDEQVANKISSLGRGLCGFHFVNITRAEGTRPPPDPPNPEKWRLSAADDQGKFYREYFQTRILSSSLPSNWTRTAVMGEPFTLQCGQPIIQKFCSLFNPEGHTVYARDCSYYIPTVTMKHLGVWTCYSGNPDTMEGAMFTVELKGKGPEHVVTWQNETDTRLNIGCRIENYRGGTLQYCKITAPDRLIYNIKEGLATERYLALGTNFITATCQLEIQKPLEEREKGQWQCELFKQYRQPMGAFIKVASDQIPEYPKHVEIITELEKPFGISCVIPYASDYCHIRAPNGTIYRPEDDKQSTLGRCTFNVTESTPSDNGTWVCLFARETGMPDEEISVEVFIAEVLAYYRTVEVDSGDSAQLLCRSGGYVLLYCRFISPSGTSYHIQNRQNSSFISYYGDGLEYGDCGITIENVKSTDNGYWTCVTKLYRDSDEPEVKAQILLNVTPYLMDGANLAGIGIGIAVGVVVVSAVVGFIGFKTWKRRQHSELIGSLTDRRSVEEDVESHNSETIFNAGPPPRSYTNPQSIPLDDHEHQL